MSLSRLSAVSLLALAAACSSAPSAPAPAKAEGALARSFAASASANQVPRELLVAIAHVEGGLDMPALRDNLDPDSHVPVAGPLQLRRGHFDSLARGAALMNTTELALRRDADLALEASARVLAELGARTRARATDLASWEAAVEELSGYADDRHRREYAHRVFAALARGGAFEGRDGETITLPPNDDIPPSLTLDLASTLRPLAGQSEYPAAEWIPTSCTNKCNVGRGGESVGFVVIHDTEGGWDASVATLQNDSGKSVQYIVGVDGRVGQFVSEEDTAWHSGNSFYNARSVGIEHVGYATKAFPNPLYEASAKLVTYLTQKYKVPVDRGHIIGHDQIPDGGRISSTSAPCPDSPKTCTASGNYGGANNHNDPGVWEWATYMARIGGAAKCNDVTAIWNCSVDHTQAFRCETGTGTFQLLTCDGAGGCETKPNGQDDVCHVADHTPAPAPAAPDPAPAPEPAPAPPPAAAPAQDSGCSAAPSTTGHGAAPALLAGLGLAAMLRRRRRA